MWESKYQQLVELVGPFKTQLEQYSVERETLMEQKNTTQKELGRLADDYAKYDSANLSSILPIGSCMFLVE